MIRKFSALCAAALLLSGCGGSDSDESGVNLPTITNVPQMAVAGLPFQFQPALSGNTSAIQFSAKGLPDWASVDRDSGIITGTPGTDDVTAYHPFQLVVITDGQSRPFDAALTVAHTAEFQPRQAVDFRATDYDGNPRPLRNDLSNGNLADEVMFAQSHTVKPNGNYDRDAGDETRSHYKPRLVALREALLMFTPEASETPVTVHAQLHQNGDPIRELALVHPNDLPASDHEGRHRIEYSTRAWSTTVPWNLVRNGLSVTFVVNKGAPDERSGTLAAADIDIGEASQIVFQSIRLGMLTHVDHNNGHFTLRDPVMAATDYFQTLPVSRMIMASYADMELDRVIIANGKIYDSVSDSEGGVYSGDMRENVAKSQVSVGINQANYGVTSSNMSQRYGHVFKQITNHHAWGNYQNGRQGHGLSGGNGIGTLYDSWGNEASHEWGHAYGLGHYPGANLTEDGRWQRHHADSGWGFIAHRNRMRDNLSHNSWSEDKLPDGSHFLGRIPYRYDSMSGGGGGNRFSHYTHYTGYTARIIQNDLAQFPIPDTSYATGYKMWNTETGQYEPHMFTDGIQPRVPVQVGVPVATLLGGYDPDGSNAVIYPVFHGNYGNVFELPKPAPTGDSCWLTVRNGANQQKQIAVAAGRHTNATINQFHVNLEADFRPTEATLNCRRNGSVAELARTSFDGQIPELPPAAIVGQERGFKQLAAREIATLNETLGNLADDAFPVVDANTQVLLASHDIAELSSTLDNPAKQVLQALQERHQNEHLASALITRLERDNASPAKIGDKLTDFLIQKGFIKTAEDLEFEGTVLRNGNQQLGLTPDEDGYLPVINSADDHPDAARWLMSARGSLHPVEQPWLCLAPTSGRLGLALCDPSRENQQWRYREDTTLQNLGSGQCIDYAWHNQTVLMYGCHGNGNQRWQGVTRTGSPLLAALPGYVVRALYQR